MRKPLAIAPAHRLNCSSLYSVCVLRGGAPVGMVCFLFILPLAVAGQRNQGRMKILSHSDSHKGLEFINQRILLIPVAIHLKLIKCVELQGGCIRDSRPCSD